MEATDSLEPPSLPPHTMEPIRRYMADLDAWTLTGECVNTISAQLEAFQLVSESFVCGASECLVYSKQHTLVHHVVDGGLICCQLFP